METLGVAAAAVALLIAGYYLFSLRPGALQSHKSGVQKREEVAEAYRERMKSELGPYRDDPEALRVQKVRLLTHFNAELSRNIFFTPEEVRDLIQELAACTVD